jgi:hypothetical protein
MLLSELYSLYPDTIGILAPFHVFFSFMLSTCTTCRRSPFFHVLQLATNHIILQGRIGLIYLHAAATDIQLSLEIIIYRANRRHYDYDTERPVQHMQICYEED